jgi:hypothetical protein
VRLSDAEATAAGVRFIQAMMETVQFVFFVTELATRADQVRDVAARALADTARTEEEAAKHRSGLDEKHTTKRLREFRQVIFQMLLTRFVDLYLTYVSELLASIFLRRPETLRSSEQISVEFVLQHDTLEDVVGSLAERRVERLAYQGIDDLAAYLEREMGFELFENDADLSQAVRIVEDRNIIVHNHAVVNNRYAKKVPDPPREVGQTLDLDFDDVFADLEFLARTAVEVDGRAAAKWSLPIECVYPSATKGEQRSHEAH